MLETSLPANVQAEGHSTTSLIDDWGACVARERPRTSAGPCVPGALWRSTAHKETGSCRFGAPDPYRNVIPTGPSPRTPRRRA